MRNHEERALITQVAIFPHAARYVLGYRFASFWLGHGLAGGSSVDVLNDLADAFAANFSLYAVGANVSSRAFYSTSRSAPALYRIAPRT